MLFRSTIELATQFIPYVGGIAYFVYSHFVEAPLEVQRSWENRLRAHLLQLHAAGVPGFAWERAWLPYQEANPLEPTDENAITLSEARRHALGLPPQTQSNIKYIE